MLVLALFLSYILGAIPFGVIVGKMRGVDIRSVGSGNSGATNVYRTLGPAAGITVFALDVGKGLAAPFIARFLIGPQDYWPIALCALMAVIGHTFSCFLRFRGGKGIATGLGMALGLAPLPALITFALWGLALLLTRMISAASLIACVLILPLAYFMAAPLPYVVVLSVIVVVAFIKHIPNLKRIAAGTEPKVNIGRKKPPQDAPASPQATP